MELCQEKKRKGRGEGREQRKVWKKEERGGGRWREEKGWELPGKLQIYKYTNLILVK